MKLKIALLIILTSNFTFGQDYNSYEVNSSTKINHFIFNTSFGPSFRLGKADKGFNAEQAKYMKDLKSGFSYDFSFYYTENGRNCFGLKFNKFRSSGGIDGQYVTAPNGKQGYSYVSDDINIIFIGPSYMLTRKIMDGKLNFQVDVAVGYMGYLDKSFIFNNYTIKGSTFGVATGFGMNYNICKEFSVGPKVSLLGGSLTKVDIRGNNGYELSYKYPKDKYESLWRIDLGLNAIFKF